MGMPIQNTGFPGPGQFPGGGTPPTPPSIAQMSSGMVTRFDKNGDGAISVASEADSRLATILQKIDAASGADGNVTADEISAFHSQYDSNSNGSLDRNEFQAFAQAAGLPAPPQGAGGGFGPRPGGVGQVGQRGQFGPPGGAPREPLDIATMAQRIIQRAGNGTGAIDLATAATGAQQSGRGAGMLQRLQEADGNGDGSVSLEEITAQLKSKDANGDGKLGFDEIGPPPGAKGVPVASGGGGEVVAATTTATGATNIVAQLQDLIKQLQAALSQLTAGTTSA